MTTNGTCSTPGISLEHYWTILCYENAVDHHIVRRDLDLVLDVRPDPWDDLGRDDE